MFASFRWVVALTAALAVVFAVSGWAVEGIQWSRLPRELVLVALNTLPLLAVRRNPLAVVAVFSVTYPTWGRALLPDAINRFVELTPMGPLVSAIRDPWHGHGNDPAALAALTVIAVIAGLLAERRLRRE